MLVVHAGKVKSSCLRTDGGPQLTSADFKEAKKKKKKSNLELGNNIFSQQTYLLRMLKNSLYFQGKVFRCVYGLDYSKGRSCM